MPLGRSPLERHEFSLWAPPDLGTGVKEVPPGWPEPRQAQAPGSGPGPARPAKPRRRVAGGGRGGAGRARGLSPAGTRCRKPAPRPPAPPTPKPWRSGPQGRRASERADRARAPRLWVAGRPRGTRRGVWLDAADAETLSSGTESRHRGSAAAPGEEAGTTTMTLRRPAPSALCPAPPGPDAPLAPITAFLESLKSPS